MIDEVFGNTFCLIHASGVRLFPVRIRNRDTGKIAFRISRGGTGGNTKDAGSEETNEFVVFDRVIRDRWSVRVASLDCKIEGLYKLNRCSITGYKDYRIDPLRATLSQTLSCTIQSVRHYQVSI
jgi:hypothetical protein